MRKYRTGLPDRDVGSTHPLRGRMGEVVAVPELPEIHNLAGQMDAELTGESISGAEVRQEKCLNLPVEEFVRTTAGEVIEGADAHGKWILVRLASGKRLLVNLGMGADLRYHESGSSSDDFQVQLHLGRPSLSFRFWWFGHVHLVAPDDVAQHSQTAVLGPDALDRDLTEDCFLELLQGRRGRIKSFLLNQRNLAGIGNVYIQDILYRAGLHPERQIPSIPEDRRRQLYRVIRENLEEALRLGGIAHEKDLCGRRGRLEGFLVGYREGEECPGCGTVIEKIRVGSTASYICPQCQR
ncbi:MAG: DNA-formamidopyrimidine glycosylase family protein [Bacillota bacterium]